MPLFNDPISPLQPHMTDARRKPVMNDIQSKLAQIRAGVNGARAIADLKKLLVCRGGFTFEAAKALLGESASTSLSLLQRWGLLKLEGKRYTLDALVEAALTPDESARSAHCDFYLALAKAHDQRQDYAGLDAESANLTAAFEWALGAKEYEKALNLLDAGSGFLISINRGRAREFMKQVKRVCNAVAEHPDRLVWAKAQHLLGAAYCALVLEEASSNSVANLLNRAVECYQRALQYRTPDAAPLDYAETQNNLGVTYLYLAHLVDNRTYYMKRAFECLQRALEHYTPDATPLQYSTVQRNMGGAYLSFAEFKDRAANLKRAVECFQRALKYCSPKTAPLSYAQQQNSLGDAYFRLARIEDRDLNLYRAVECYQRALKYFTPDAAPDEYAEMQYDLGLAYQALKDEEKARAAFQEAKKRPRLILRAVCHLLSVLLFICLLLLISAVPIRLFGSLLSSITAPTPESVVWSLAAVICMGVLFMLGFTLLAAGVYVVTTTLFDRLMRLMRL
jgi:tetratricopeptide (TPR) repeat protein